MPEILESTCSQLSPVMFFIIHDSHEIFNNKNTQIKFLYEMFFAPYTSVISHFDHKKKLLPTSIIIEGFFKLVFLLNLTWR